MNRVKKELRKKGFKLECDYECLPDATGIQAVTVNSEKVIIGIHHTSISTWWKLTKSGEIEEYNLT